MPRWKACIAPAALDDGTGAMKPRLAIDGVHPNEAGYDAMATVLDPILRRMFGR